MKETIELLFNPSCTVALGDRGKAVNAVVTLMISDVAFSRFAPVVWAAAVRCHLGRDANSDPDGWAGPDTRIYPASSADSAAMPKARLGKPYPEVGTDETFELNGRSINNRPGLRERLRVNKTLARGRQDFSLELPMIESLLSQNFDFILRGFDDDDDIQLDDHGFFPTMPGVVLWFDGTQIADYRTHQLRDSNFEDRFDSALELLWGQAAPIGPGTKPGRRRGNRAFAELVFEQYFDRLISSTNDFMDAKSEEWFLQNSGAEFLLLQQLIALVELQDYREMMAQVGADLCSGLRLPTDFNPRAYTPIPPSKSLFTWTGQQFELPSVVENRDYVLEYRPRTTNPANWIAFDVEPRLPKTRELRGDLVQAMLNAPVPTELALLETVPPLEANPRRYPFSPAVSWAPSGGARRQVWGMPDTMRRELSRLTSELGPDMARLDCRYRDVGEVNSNDDDEQEHALPDARWATTVSLMIRQVADTTRDAAGGEPRKIENLYEIVGMSDKDRRVLAHIRREWGENAPSSISILYQLRDEEWISDPLSVSPASKQCLVLRTNLSTDSNPSNALRPMLTRDVQGTDIASLGSSLDFLRLVQDACTVNSGGYFLRYEPSDGTDPLSSLFGSGGQDRQRVLLTLNFGEVESGPPKPYYNTVTSMAVSSSSTARDISAIAFIERAERTASGLVWHRLVQFDEAFAPGSIGFRASRPRLPDPGSHGDMDQQATFTLDRLFSRLGFGFENPDPDVFRSFPLTLPVQPLEPGRTFLSQTARRDSSSWHWKHVIQILREPFRNPYGGIGTELPISISVRDIYGNEFPCTGAKTHVRPRLVYFDKLIGVSEWPSVKTELSVGGSSSAPELQVQLRARPFGTVVLDENGNPICIPSNASEQERVRDRYLSIQSQLADESVGCNLSVRSSGPVGADTTISIECKRQLVQLVRDVLAIDPTTEPCAHVTQTIPLAAVTFDHADDFFRVRFALEIFREAPESHFAKIRHPWNSTDEIFAPAKRVVSEVGFPSSELSAGGTSPLVTFARVFETLNRASHLRLAIVEGDEKDRDLWIVRVDRLRPTLSRGPIIPEHNYLVFAPSPLSTELATTTIENPPADVINPGAVFTPRTFVDVDVDQFASELFSSVESFLNPATVSLLAKSVDSSGEPQPEGWVILQSVLDHKRKLARVSPKGFMQRLFANSPEPSSCALGVSQRVYEQAMLTSLDAFYGVDAILPFDVSQDQITSAEYRGGIAVYGCIADQYPPEEARVSRRDSDDEGEVTFVRSVDVGSKIDLKWSGESLSRRDVVVVEQVARNTYAIAGGFGAPLPAEGERVVISLLPQSESLHYRNNKIRFFPRRFGGPDTLVVVIDQPPDALSQPTARRLFFDWTHIEFDLPNPIETEPGSGCYTDQPVPESRWLALINPIRLEVSSTPCDIPIPKRRFPVSPRVSLQGAVQPTQPVTIEASRRWTYELDFTTVIEATDELEISASLNATDDVSAKSATDSLISSLLEMRCAFPQPDAAFSVAREKLNTNVAEGLRIANEYSRYVGSFSDAIEVARTSVAKVKRQLGTRTAIYTIRERAGEHNPDERVATIQWLSVDEQGNHIDEDLPADLKPLSDPEAPSSPIPHGRMVRFEEPNSTLPPERHRERKFILPELNAFAYESCTAHLRLRRNRYLTPPSVLIPSSRHRVDDAFVYQTPSIVVPRPVTAKNDIGNRLFVADPDVGSRSTLTQHLSSVFERLFEDVETGERRMRIEFRYLFPGDQFADQANSEVPWANEFPIPSAQRLLPPRDIDVSDPSEVVEELVENLSRWKDEFDPEVGLPQALIGPCVLIDILAYSILSERDRDRPLVRLRKVLLPFKLISSWT